jgi:hypothetical protein
MADKTAIDGLINHRTIHEGLGISCNVDVSLYFACGLLLIGQGESVIRLRVTVSKRHCRSSGFKVVSAPKYLFAVV